MIGQIPICWDPDRDTAIARAHEQFRWFAGGGAVNADLPTTAGFAGAAQFVRPEHTASSIPCGPDLDAIVEAIGEYWEAGFTDIALSPDRRRRPGSLPQGGGRTAVGELRAAAA